MKIIHAIPARWSSSVTFLYVILDSAQTVRVGQSVEALLADGALARAQVSAIRPLGHRKSRVDLATPGSSCELEICGVPFSAIRR